MGLLDTLSFEVVSEDLQTPLQALLFLDFAGFSEPNDRSVLKQITIPAGHLNDPARGSSIDFAFGPVLPGCHSVTLAVSHGFQLPFGSRIVSPVVKTDVATMTWWYDVDDDPNRSASLTTCVTTAVTPSDAGTGADATESGAD